MSAEVPLHVIASVARNCRAGYDFEPRRNEPEGKTDERVVRAVIRELEVQGYEVRARAT